MRRREFFKVGVGGAASGMAAYGEQKRERVEMTSNLNKTSKPYGTQYYERAREIWNQISTTELPLIAQAADHAAFSLKKGRKLYCQITGGHMHMAEFRAVRPGNPDYLHNWSRQKVDQDFDVIEKDDFIIFDCPRERIARARSRGAFTVGIRVPYFPNRTTPKGVHAMNELAVNPVFEGIILPEECADVILTSGVPFTDGTLYIPEIPAVRVCPISPQGTFNFYWMLTAEIAARHKGNGRTGSSEKAKEYIEHVKARGARIHNNLETIDAAAKAMMECVARGGRYWNFPMRHSNESNRDAALDHDPGLWAIMLTENTERASGLAMSRLISLAQIREKGKEGDFVIIAGEVSDAKDNLEAARAFSSAGIKVIYIGPNTEGAKEDDMSRIADWHIDTFSPERAGVLVVPIGHEDLPNNGSSVCFCSVYVKRSVHWPHDQGRYDAARFYGITSPWRRCVF